MSLKTSSAVSSPILILPEVSVWVFSFRSSVPPWGRCHFSPILGATQTSDWLAINLGVSMIPWNSQFTSLTQFSLKTLCSWLQIYYKGYTQGKIWSIPATEPPCPSPVESGHVTFLAHQCLHQSGRCSESVSRILIRVPLCNHVWVNCLSLYWAQPAALLSSPRVVWSKTSTLESHVRSFRWPALIQRLSKGLLGVTSVA